MRYSQSLQTVTINNASLDDLQTNVMCTALGNCGVRALSFLNLQHNSITSEGVDSICKLLLGNIDKDLKLDQKDINDALADSKPHIVPVNIVQSKRSANVLSRRRQISQELSS
eukprot:SAG31_NODE_11992_length_979_cov_1.406818_1_plen_113_part_00